jgi:Flp pilus assembly pilin Flp
MSEFVTKQIVVAQVLVTKLRERAEEGQSMVEYALIMAFISIVAIAALTHLGHDISKSFDVVANSLPVDANSL